MEKKQMKGNKILILILALVLLISSVSAEDLTFKKSDIIDLKVNCFDTNNNICYGACQISVIAPNGSTFIDLGSMSLSGLFFNYTLPQIQEIGLYKSVVNCSDTINSGYTNFDFMVTYGGRNLGGDNINIVFSILFLLILGFLIYTTVNCLIHFFKVDMDILDLLLIWVSYIVIWGFYTLGLYYWGNDMALGIIQIFLDVGIYTHLMVPVFAFFISLIAGGYKRKKQEDG
jgi:hypothetical protein